MSTMKLRYVSLSETLAFVAGKAVAEEGRHYPEIEESARRAFGESTRWEDYVAVRFTDGTGLVVTGSALGGWSEYTPEGGVVVNLAIVEGWSS